MYAKEKLHFRNRIALSPLSSRNCRSIPKIPSMEERVQRYNRGMMGYNVYFGIQSLQTVRIKFPAGKNIDTWNDSTSISAQRRESRKAVISNTVIQQFPCHHMKAQRTWVPQSTNISHAVNNIENDLYGLFSLAVPHSEKHNKGHTGDSNV